MTAQTFQVPVLGESNEGIEPSEWIRNLVEQQISNSACDFETAAAVWARLYYEHASYVENSLGVRSVSFATDTSGTLSLDFDYTQQDGCSDIFREGSGHVEFQFHINNGQLELTWSLPIQPSTADEL
ncbi:MAG: hypothetical protein ACYTGL_14300 [Planctomycetota bacterium]|jgi:hypothetical protein